MVSAVDPIGGRVSPALIQRPGDTRATLRALAALGRRADLRDPGLRREVAGQFAADLFFAPLLAEMRQFPLGRGLIDGGQTEAIFGQQLDQRVADRVALSSTRLVTEIADRFQPAHRVDERRWVGVRT